MKEDLELLQSLHSLHLQHNRETDELIEEWVQRVRKYPNGFKFLYDDEEATITGATSSFDPRKEVACLLTPEEVYIVYTCYVPSICDHIHDVKGNIIGNRPGYGVYIAEFNVDKVLREKTENKKCTP